MPTVPEKQEDISEQGSFFKKGEVENFAADMARSETENLNVHLKEGRKINPGTAARVAQMQTKTGLPPSVVHTSLDELEFKDKTNQIPPDFWKKSPLTAEYIRKNSPFYAGMSDEEILGMGNTENLLGKNPNTWRRPKKDIDRLAGRLAKQRLERFVTGGGALDPRDFQLGPDVIELTEEQLERTFDQMLRQTTQEIEFEEDFIGSDAPVGGIETLQKRFQENSLFMVPFVSAGADTRRLLDLYRAASAIEDGTATEDQMATMVRYGRLAEASERRGQSVIGITAGIAAELAPFAIELGLTAGTFTAAKGITQKSLKAAGEKLLRGSIQKVLKRKLPLVGTIDDFATRNASRIVGTLVQSVAAGPGRIAANTVQAMTPIGQTQFGDDGSVSFQVSPNSGKSFTVALKEGVLRQFNEVFSEKLGGPLGRAFAKTGVGKAFTKRFIASGGKAEALQQTLQKFGIHGVFAEMGEEEVNKFMLDIEGIETYTLPTAKELKAQALAFGAPTVLTGGLSLVDRRTNATSETWLEDLAEQVAEDATILENQPIEYKRMLHEAVKGTNKETVEMPIEQFNQLFAQKLDDEGNPINPRDVISEVMGDAKAYDEAMETGGDISIPMEEYATTLNQSDFADEIRQISKFDPLDVTNAEFEKILDELELNIQEQEPGLEDQERRAQAALSAQRVADDIRSQFDETSPKFDAVAADAYATLYERVFRTLGLRSGQDPFELYNKFQFKVTEARDAKPRPTAEGREISRADLDKTIEEETAKLEEAGDLKRRELEDLADPAIESDPVTTAETVGALEKQERASKKAIKEAQKRQEELDRDGEDAKVFFQNISQTVIDRAGGTIAIGKNSIDITLLERANLTTFLHESGHFYLELIKDLATAPDAAQGLKDDFQRVKNWFKEKPLKSALFEIEMNVKMMEREAKTNKSMEEPAKIAREAFETAKKGGQKFMDEFTDSFGENTDEKFFGVLMTPYHEQWARGFEMYLSDPANSPVKELNGLFHRFGSWIIGFYRDLRRLDVKLSTDIKDVMSRMLATQEEIEESMAEQGMVPLFPDPKAVGMTDEQAERYQKDIGDALQKAEEDLSKKAIELETRKKKAAWRDRKKIVQPEVEAEANEMKVYKALANMQLGKNADGSALDSGVFQAKLDKKALLEAIGSERLKALPRPFIYTPKGGIDLATASTMFGYESPTEMIHDIESSVKKSEFVREETNRRLNEEFGDPLSADVLPDEVNKAIHNEKRSQLLKKELDYLVSDSFATFKKLARKITRPIPTIKEVRNRAEEIINGKEIGRISPIIYKRGEAKASKAAIEAFLKGDFETVVDAKQLELLNHELFRSATAANERVSKDLKAFRPIRKANKKTAKGRDMGLVNTAKSVLFEYGLGKETDKTLQESMEFLRKYGRSDQADVLTSLASTVIAVAKPFKESTFEEFSLMSKTVKALWRLSKSTKELELKDRRVSIEEAGEELAAATNERKEFKDAPDVPTIFGKKSKRDIKRSVYGWKSALTRVESWVRSMDKGSPTGPFRRFIWNPIIQGTTQSTVKAEEFINKYKEALKEVEGDITRDAIKAPEIDFEFRDKAQLLGALLHIGNDSNLSKLLRGRDWGQFDSERNLDSQNWERFRRRMETEGILTKKDYEFLQKSWDLFEKTKPFVQRTMLKLYGFGMNEITANPVETSFGTFRGGYAPAVIDYMDIENINEAERQRLMNQDEKEDLNNAFTYPTTPKGFLENRFEDYARPLQMNLELVPMHIQKVMRFSFIEAPVRDVYDLLRNDTFRDSLNKFDPTAISDMLMPWLERTARQRISTPSDGTFGGKGMDAIYRAIRKRSSQSIMFLSVVNALQQFTGISVAATVIKPRFLRNSFVEYMKNPKTFGSDIAEKDPFMATRNVTSVIEQLNEIEKIVINPGKLDRVRDAADRHALFMQIATQGFVDNVVWNGAYNQAIQELGLSEGDAILHAGAMVRETQGGFTAESISAAEATTPFKKLFITFYGYFNMLANTLGTEFSIAMRTTTGFDKASRMFYIYIMGIMIPAVVAESISVALRGDFDEDDDEEYLDDFISLFFGSQAKTVLASVPGVGAIGQTAINNFNDKWWDDRLSISPAISQLEKGFIKAPVSIFKAIQDKGKTSTAIKDTLALFNLFFGLPTTQAGKTAGFFTDLAEGEQDAAGFLEFSKGIIGGRSQP